jgi:S1-C subfamily serine protease
MYNFQKLNMKRYLILLLFIHFFFVGNAFGQIEVPHSTIHIIRTAGFAGSACRTDITLPNQRNCNLPSASIINYKIFSSGEISIDIEINCPGVNGTYVHSPPTTSTKQVTLNIKTGNEYFVLFEAAGKNAGFKEITKEQSQIYAEKCKNILEQKENIEFPINKQSLSEISKNLSGQGTCFAISPNGYLVTNYHCIENAKEITVKGIDGDLTTKYGATVVASDPSNDLAILKIGNKNVKFNTPSFGFRSSGVAQAEKVYALGFPSAAAMGTEVKITEGIISAKSGVGGDVSKFQISAAVNSGNSGGPLIDEQGNLIGVIFAKSTIAESAGYAIKSSYLETFLKNVDGFEFPTFVNSMKDKPFTEKVADWKNYIFIVETN